MEVNDDGTQGSETVENETHGEATGVSRRSFLQASGAVAGLAALGVGTGRANAAAAGSGASRDFLNWRVREAAHVWERGYRGRPDRTLALTDSGVEARHPDLGPWNGVRAEIRDGELVLPASTRERVDTGEGESFSGTIGPGTFLDPVQRIHEFTTPDGVEEIDATMTWTPESIEGQGEDLELYLDRRVDGEWRRVAASTNAGQPERVVNYVAAGENYRFVVETYVNVTADYEITADYFAYEGTFEALDPSAVFADVDPSDITADTPKTVGWYDAGSRYGTYDAPRDPDGHGSHCTSIMAGSGRASAIDPDSVIEESPRTVLAAGDVVTYEVDAAAGTGVYASAYGDAIEIIIEGPDGQELDSSAVGSDTSEWDNNVAESPTVHASGTATYTVHVRPAGGETASTGRLERVSVGAFLDPASTAADRTGEAQSLHGGLAPDSSVVGLQGLSGPTHDLGEHAGAFAETFNMRAVNMSWGYTGGLPLGAFGGLVDSIPARIKQIAEAGVLTVTAAGNAATPANGNGSPGIADEAVSVAATGPLDGLVAYSSGGVGGIDEDDGGVYMKPEITAPGGSLTDLAVAALAGDPDLPESEQPPIRDYTGKAGTSMASPYVTGVSGLVAQAMEEDAPADIALPAPGAAGIDDVYRFKQALLATASETVFTAAPYHRAHAPTYDFGGRDPYEGFGRVNPGAAVDAVSRELPASLSAEVGLNVPEDERAVAGHVTAGPGTLDVSVSFSHYSGANKGMAEAAPHVDLFVYDAANPGKNGDPNVLGRAQGLQGDASLSVSFGRDAAERTVYVVAKLVNVPGATNGYDVQAHLDLTTSFEAGFFVSGSRSDDGTVFTGGQTNQVDLTVNPSEKSRVRDVVPSEWTVLTEHSDDVERVEDAGDVQYVYFKKAKADADTSYTYFVEAPAGAEHSNEYVFGPVEVDPGTGWVAVSGTSDTNVVAALET